MEVNLIHISYASMNLLIYAIKNNCFVVSPLAPLRHQVAGACDIPPRRATGSAIPAILRCYIGVFATKTVLFNLEGCFTLLKKPTWNFELLANFLSKIQLLQNSECSRASRVAHQAPVPWQRHHPSTILAIELWISEVCILNLWKKQSHFKSGSLIRFLLAEPLDNRSV